MVCNNKIKPFHHDLGQFPHQVMKVWKLKKYDFGLDVLIEMVNIKFYIYTVKCLLDYYP